MKVGESARDKGRGAPPLSPLRNGAGEGEGASPPAPRAAGMEVNAGESGQVAPKWLGSGRGAGCLPK